MYLEQEGLGTSLVLPNRPENKGKVETSRSGGAAALILPCRQLCDLIGGETDLDGELDIICRRDE